MPKEPPFTYEEVLLEIERQQTGKKSWVNNLAILLISLLVFFQLGLFESGVVDIIIIIGVILIHEVGHFIGMRLFGYRNVQMFFIPLFGAAVSGQSRNVAAYKKAIVSLLGPVPGIVLGIVVSIVFVMTRVPALLKFGMMLVIINGFNLLPFFPLDGGRFLHEVVFSRNRYIELLFKVLAALCLLGVGLLLQAWILAIFGLASLLAVTVPFKLAGIAGDVRQSLRSQDAGDGEPLPTDAGISPPIMQLLADQNRQELFSQAPDQGPPTSPEVADSQTIPADIAADIVDKVRRKFPSQTGLKMVAHHTKDVWERIQARPPRAGATMGLLFTYALCFFLSLAAVVSLAAAYTFGGGFVKTKIVEYQDQQGQTRRKEQVYVLGSLAEENDLDPNSRLFHGRSIAYDYDGRVIGEGTWCYGRKDGQWKEYDPNGTLVSVTTFERGKFVLEKQLEDGRWVEKGWDDLPDWQRDRLTEEMQAPPEGPEPVEKPPAKPD